MSERRILSASRWLISGNFDEECLKAYKLRHGEPELDEEYCASCSDFSHCRLVEAVYLRKRAELFKGIKPKSLSQMRIKEIMDGLLKEMREMQMNRARQVVQS